MSPLRYIATLLADLERHALTLGEQQLAGRIGACATRMQARIEVPCSADVGLETMSRERIVELLQSAADAADLASEPTVARWIHGVLAHEAPERLSGTQLHASVDLGDDPQALPSSATPPVRAGTVRYDTDASPAAVALAFAEASNDVTLLDVVTVDARTLRVQLASWKLPDTGSRRVDDGSSMVQVAWDLGPASSST